MQSSLFFTVICACAIVAPAAPNVADDAAAPVMERIETLRADLRSGELSASRREAILREVLDARSRLIEQHADDPRRAVWMADQAEDIYVHALRADALAITARLGVPAPAQRQRAARAARDLHEWADRAEIAIEQMLFDLESRDGFAEDRDLQLQRRRLAETERDRRVPFLVGAGAHLHASLNVDDPETREHLHELAVDRLKSSADRLDASLAAEARLLAALALLELERHDDAAALIDTVTRAPRADEMTRFAARLAEARLIDRPRAARRALDEIEADYAGDEHHFHRLLITDQRFLLALRERRERGAGADELADAIQVYLDHLEAMAGEEAEASLRRAIFGRLTAAAQMIPRGEDMPAIVRLAYAAGDLEADTAPEQREAAIETLARLIREDSLAAREEVLALEVIARALEQDGHTREAVAALLRIARDHAASRAAEPAMQRALHLAFHAERDAPGAATDRLAEALAVAFRQYTNLPEIDRWRLVAGSIARHEQQFDEALHHFEAVPRGSDERPHAQFERAVTIHAAARQADDETARRSWYRRLIDIEPDVRRALAGDDVDSDRAPVRRQRLSVMVAEAYLERDHPEHALARLDALTDGEANDDALDETIRGEVLRLRIAAHHARGEREAAQRAVGAYLERDPERAATVIADLMRSIERDVHALEEALRMSEARNRAARELQPLADLLTEHWPDDLAGAPGVLRLRVAEAYRLAGQWSRALPLYDAALAEHPNVAEALLGRAECLYHMAGDDDTSQLGEAMLQYRRLAAAGPEAGHHGYWQSQMRMLQILDRLDRNTDRIAPRIQQLRRQDADLGGRRYEREFLRLQNRHAR